MKHLLSTAATVAATLTGTMALTTNPANAYQIDCAILLCLSGGWPPSAPCVAAKIEFIRRITPFPIEPPLQIWRCPMSAAYEVGPAQSPAQRLYDIAFGDAPLPLQSLDKTAPEQELWRAGQSPAPEPISALFRTLETIIRPNSSLLQPVADYTSENGVADIDISDPAFDFVRSIRVFSVEHLSQTRKVSSDGAECVRSFRIRLGRYGEQGDFYWSASDPYELPSAYVGNERWGDDCPYVSRRSVFVDWTDYEQNYDYEQVDY